MAASWALPDLQESQDLMEMMAKTVNRVSTASRATTPRLPTTMALLLRTVLGNALQARRVSQDLLEIKELVVILEMPVNLASLESPEPRDRREEPGLQDLPDIPVALERKASQASRSKWKHHRAHQEGQESQEPLEIQDLLERRASPESLDPRGRREIKEILVIWAILDGKRIVLGPYGKPGTAGPPGEDGAQGAKGSCDHCPPPRTPPGY